MKKILILNGSPRPRGDTQALIDAFLSGLSPDDECRVVSCRDKISPCLDCRYCHTHDGCAIRDGMDEIYAYLAVCDVVVLASPVWFSALSGPALDLSSRLQTYFAAKYLRRESIAIKPKRGVILLCGGQAGTEKNAVESARIILSLVNVKKEDITVVTSMDTDRVAAKDDTEACRAAKDAAAKL